MATARRIRLPLPCSSLPHPSYQFFTATVKRSSTGMSVRTVTEIEATIERQPSDELRALVNWIEEYAAAIGASETLFGMYDAEEEQSGAESQAR